MGIIADFDYLKFGETCQTGATSNDDFAPWWVASIVASLCLVFCVMILLYVRKLYTKEKNKNFTFGFSGSMERKMYPYMGCLSFFLNCVGFSLLFCLLQLFRWKALIPVMFFSTVLISIWYFWYPSNVSEKKRDEINLERSSREGLGPRNVYMDFSRRMEYVYLTFVLQVMLTAVYFLSVLNSADAGIPCFNQPSAYGLMWLAIFLRAIYFSLNNSYRSHNYFRDWTFWETMRKVIEANNKVSSNGEKYMVTWSAEDTGDDKAYNYAPQLKREITKIQYYSRYSLHVIINGAVESLLSLLMVIQSANGNFTDFVLNFVAARFIIGLDDYCTWTFCSKFWIVRNCILEEQEEAQKDSSTDDEDRPIDSSVVGGESNQWKDSDFDEESNKSSDSSILDKESSNQTHTNIQRDSSQRNQSLANQDPELASQDLKVQILTHEVQSLTDEVQTHKHEVQTLKNQGQKLTDELQTLKNDFQALLKSRQEFVISHHETTPNNRNGHSTD